jgi:hypothetical protein
MIRRSLLAILAAALLSNAAHADQLPYTYGPKPDWTRYKALGNATMRATLPEPDRWLISWPHGYIATGWLQRKEGRFLGYLSCGLLEDRAMREPVRMFAIVVDYGQVKTIEIANRNNLVKLICGNLIEQGKLPPASAMEQPADIAITRLGMTIRAMPDGATIVAITSDAPAARSGLVTGMTITQANGIALAGMGNAMVAVLDASTPMLSLTTATGQAFSIPAVTTPARESQHAK